MARLGDIGKVITVNTPKTADIENYSSKDIPFIKPSDIQEDRLTMLSESEFYISEHARKTSRILSPGGVLVTCIGIVGKVAINNMECAFNQQINAIAPDSEKCDAKYIAYAIQSQKHKLENVANAAVVPIINKTQFSDIEIPVPPLEEQRRIAAMLDKVSDLIAKRRAQLGKLDLLVKAKFVEMFGDPVTNPHRYPVHQLSDYIEFLTSGSRGWSHYFSDEGEYFITIKNVKDCRITLDTVQYVVPPDNAEAKRTKVQEGDLLISITADLGRTGIVTKEIADHGAYINQHLTCIRLNQKMVLPLYAAYYMESDAGKGQFQAKNQSAVKAGLNFNSINSLRLMVPPMELQNHFIAYIKQSDKTKLMIQKSLNRLEILKKALMQQYFG